MGTEATGMEMGVGWSLGVGERTERGMGERREGMERCKSTLPQINAGSS